MVLKEELLRKKIDDFDLKLSTVIYKEGFDPIFFVPISDFFEINTGPSDSKYYFSTRNTCKTFELLKSALFGERNPLFGLRDSLLKQDINELILFLGSEEKKAKMLNLIREIRAGLPNNPYASEVFYPTRLIEAASSENNENLALYMNFVGKADWDMNSINKDLSNCLLSRFCVNIFALPWNLNLPVLIDKRYQKGISTNFINSLKSYYKHFETIQKDIVEKSGEIIKTLRENSPIVADWLESARTPDEQIKCKIIDAIMSKIKEHFVQVDEKLLQEILSNNFDALKEMFTPDSIEINVALMIENALAKMQDEETLNISKNSEDYEVYYCEAIHYIQTMATAIMLTYVDDETQPREAILSNILNVIRQIKEGVFKFDEKHEPKYQLVEKMLAGIEADISKKTNIVSLCSLLFQTLNAADHVTQMEFLKLKKERSFENGFFKKDSGTFVVPLQKICEILKIPFTLNQDFRCLDTDENLHFSISISVESLLESESGCAKLLKTDQLTKVEKLEIIQHIIYSKDIRFFEDLPFDEIKKDDVLLSLAKQKILEAKSPILLALRCRDIDLAVQLIEGGKLDINIPGKCGLTPLIYAAREGYTEVVSLLLAHNAEPNVSDEYGNTPLMYAAHKGHTDAVRLLFEHDAKVDVSDKNGDTSLMKAVQGNNIDVVKFLMEHGADPNVSNSDGSTPMSCAIRHGRISMATYLLNCGANPCPRNNSTRSPLVSAICNMHVSLVCKMIYKIMVNTLNDKGDFIKQLRRRFFRNIPKIRKDTNISDLPRNSRDILI